MRYFVPLNVNNLLMSRAISTLISFSEHVRFIPFRFSFECGNLELFLKIEIAYDPIDPHNTSRHVIWRMNTFISTSSACWAIYMAHKEDTQRATMLLSLNSTAEKITSLTKCRAFSTRKNAESFLNIIKCHSLDTFWNIFKLILKFATFLFVLFQ